MQLWKNIPVTDLRGHTHSRLQPVGAPDKDFTLPTDAERRVVFFFPGFNGVPNPHQETLEHTLSIKSKVLGNLMGGPRALDTTTDYYTAHYEEVLWYKVKKAVDAATGFFAQKNAPILHRISVSPHLLGRSLHSLRYKHNPPVYYSKEAKEFGQHVMFPIMQAHYRDPSLTHDEKLAAIARDFRRITFVSESYGGIFAGEVANYLEYAVPYALPRISDTELKGLLRNIVHVCAPNVLDGNYPVPYTTVYLTGHHDRCHQFMTKGKWSEMVEMARLQESAHDALQEPASLQRHGTLVLRHAPHFSEIAFDPPEKYSVHEEILEPSGRRQTISYHNVPNHARHDTLSFLLPQGEDARHLDLLGTALTNALARPLESAVTAEDVLPARAVERILGEQQQGRTAKSAAR